MIINVSECGFRRRHIRSSLIQSQLETKIIGLRPRFNSISARNVDSVLQSNLKINLVAEKIKMSERTSFVASNLYLSTFTII